MSCASSARWSIPEHDIGIADLSIRCVLHREKLSIPFVRERLYYDDMDCFPRNYRASKLGLIIFEETNITYSIRLFCKRPFSILFSIFLLSDLSVRSECLTQRSQNRSVIRELVAVVYRFSADIVVVPLSEWEGSCH